MSAIYKLWKRWAKSKKYREAFVASQFKRGIPFQIRALRAKRGWSQAELAKHAGLTQGVISRAEDPDYGNLAFNTVLRIAAGFDVAFVGMFIPFTQLARLVTLQSEDSVQVPSFDDDLANLPQTPSATTSDADGVPLVGVADTGAEDRLDRYDTAGDAPYFHEFEMNQPVTYARH